MFTTIIAKSPLFTLSWMVHTHSFLLLHVPLHGVALLLTVASFCTDWTSLTQVKELGMVVRDCPMAADDARRIFDMYFYAANRTSLPQPWPYSYDTEYNAVKPMQVSWNGSPVSAFIAASPREFCTDHRTPDGDAVLDAMAAANSYGIPLHTVDLWRIAYES